MGYKLQFDGNFENISHIESVIWIYFDIMIEL
jgi:hypothetical protein